MGDSCEGTTAANSKPPRKPGGLVPSATVPPMLLPFLTFIALLCFDIGDLVPGLPEGVGGTLAMMALFALIPISLAVLYSALSLPLHLYRAVFRRDRASRILAAVAAFTILAYFAGHVVGSRLRTAFFARVAQRAQPLIDAIDRFRGQNGRPPESIEDLVPSLLPAVPVSGYPDDRNFHYRQVGRGSLSASYRLSLNVGRGFGFDLFVFSPEQDYADLAQMGGVERIGKWAYLHE